MNSTRSMHSNSLLAFYLGEQGLFSKREKMVLDAIRKTRKATDREIMLALGFVDPNTVRPRITGLITAGVLEEVGETVDPITQKTVRIVALRPDPRTPVRQFEFVLQPITQ